MGVNRSPASILFDSSGNAVGVVQDGTVYRLQVQTTITDSDGNGPAQVDEIGTRFAQSVSYPELLAVMLRIEQAIDKTNRHLASITEEEDPL